MTDRPKTPPSDIAKTRARLAEAVSSTVALAKQNGLLVGLCPFHAWQGKLD